MAGLGETCTHVAAVLFFLEALYRLQGKETCTEKQCEWIMPKFQKNMEYLPLKGIDFTSAKGKKKKLDNSIDCGETFGETSESALGTCSCSTDEIDLLYKNLSESDSKPAVLSLIPEYSSTFISHTSLEFPKPLLLLYDPNFLKLSYHELLDKCESVDISITERMVLTVEKESRKQSKSKTWFKYRSGRITASRMQSVCSTNASHPSQTLIKQICYPESYRFHSKQTAWGCDHEKLARRRYEEKMKSLHQDFKVNDNGFIINPQWPFLGATPDGSVSCACCGMGVVEIKCPYCHRGETVETASQDKKFCLIKNSHGKLALDHTHAYYYQIQTQLFVANVEYCDFCVCTFVENEQNDLHIERLAKDSEFWTNCIEKAHCFFKTCVLPELLGKWYTRSNQVYAVSFDTSVTGSHNESRSDQEFCYCKGPEEGTMIACDNPNCMIEWFHLECLKIQSVPKGKSKWYCPDCRKLPEFTRKKKKTA